MSNPIIIDRETGEKLREFHNKVGNYLSELNETFGLNYYELIGVLETIIFTLHDDAMNDEEGEE